MIGKTMKSLSVCEPKYNHKGIIYTGRSAMAVTVAGFDLSVKEYEHRKALDTRKETA